MVRAKGALSAAPAFAMTIEIGPRASVASAKAAMIAGLVGHIGGERTDALMLRGDGLERFAPAAEDGDARARLGERQRDGRADAGAAAGDERMLSGKILHGAHTFVAMASPRAASRQSWSRPGQ